MDKQWEWACRMSSRAQHDTNISFSLVIAEPGGGPRLHRYKYDEVVYVISGRPHWTVNGQEREAKAGMCLS
jgi:quercetin dioxygenase-like cupin family protein